MNALSIFVLIPLIMLLGSYFSCDNKKWRTT